MLRRSMLHMAILAILLLIARSTEGQDEKDMHHLITKCVTKIGEGVKGDVERAWLTAKWSGIENARLGGYVTPPDSR